MTRILVVDDEPVNLMIMQSTLEGEGYAIDEAEDGESAWEMMQEHQYDVVVLDRIMPRLNGLDLLKRIKASSRWTSLPIIMQTAANKQQEILEGLESGAYYYLTKPYEPQVLRMLIRTIVHDQTEKARLKKVEGHFQSAISLLQTGEFRFRTIDEANHIAATVASVCQERESAVSGLIELLINAIEHGNLGITYQEKSQLRLEDRWDEEIERRFSQEPWASRQVRLSFRRDGEFAEFTIIDEGNGFDWKPFLTFDPSRAFDLHGRGIAMANLLSFSSIEYQGNGNTVIARTKAS